MRYDNSDLSCSDSLSFFVVSFLAFSSSSNSVLTLITKTRSEVKVSAVELGERSAK